MPIFLIAVLVVLYLYIGSQNLDTIEARSLNTNTLVTATLVGFGAAVVIIQIMQPEARTAGAWLSIGNFVLSASMLGASFVALASVISVTTVDKARAAGLALVTWLATVIIFDLCLLAVLVLSGGTQWEQSIFPHLLYLNPIDIFRLINLTTLGSGSGNELFMGMTASHAYRPWVLYFAMLLWIVVPFVLSQFLFRRKEV